MPSSQRLPPPAATTLEMLNSRTALRYTLELLGATVQLIYTTSGSGLTEEAVVGIPARRVHVSLAYVPGNVDYLRSRQMLSSCRRGPGPRCYPETSVATRHYSFRRGWGTGGHALDRYIDYLSPALVRAYQGEMRRLLSALQIRRSRIPPSGPDVARNVVDPTLT